MTARGRAAVPPHSLVRPGTFGAAARDVVGAWSGDGAAVWKAIDSEVRGDGSPFRGADHAGETPVAMVRTRYARGMSVSALVVAGLWHLANDLPTTLLNWSGYRYPATVLIGWLVFAAVCAAAGRALLVRPGGPRYPWPAAVVVLGVVTTVQVAAPHRLLTPLNWGWGAAGWVAVMLFWRRPVRHLLAFLAINDAVVLVNLSLGGDLGRMAVARYLMVVCGTGTLQLGYYGGARALNTAAGWAAAASAAAATTVARRVAADEAHRVRQRRYGVLQHSLVRLLADLVAGVSDPAEPVTQRRCATEAARLRRLVVETDDVPDPLLHELRACADIAERRGVMVDLVTVGDVPELSRPVRRALAEPVITVLAGASSRARITVAVLADQVVVGVVADGGGDAESEVPDEGDGTVEVPVSPGDRHRPGEDRVGPVIVTVSSYRARDEVWLETSVVVPAGAGALAA